MKLELWNHNEEKTGYLELAPRDHGYGFILRVIDEKGCRMGGGNLLAIMPTTEKDGEHRVIRVGAVESKLGFKVDHEHKIVIE